MHISHIKPSHHHLTAWLFHISITTTHAYYKHKVKQIKYPQLGDSLTWNKIGNFYVCNVEGGNKLMLICQNLLKTVRN